MKGMGWVKERPRCKLISPTSRGTDLTNMTSEDTKSDCGWSINGIFERPGLLRDLTLRGKRVGDGNSVAYPTAFWQNMQRLNRRYGAFVC